MKDARAGGTGRLEAFSDGVFAIAITLLVLEIHVPKGLGEGALAAAVLNEWPSYAAFVTSFLTIGIMWINHHRLFRLVGRANTPLFLLNLYVLAAVTIMPYPTGLVAEYLGFPGERLAAVFYAAASLDVGFAFWLLWRYAASPRRRPSLLEVPVDSPSVQATRRRYRFGPLFYLVAVGCAFWHAWAAVACCAALALLFALPPKSRGARRASTA
jgi:uncharacterized membrane protein